MDHILYPTFCAITDSGKSKTSKSITELANWGRDEKATLLIVRRFDKDGSIQIQPLFVYEYINSRCVRIW